MITIDDFMKDFTPDERVKVAARTVELIEEELARRLIRERRRAAKDRAPKRG